MNFNIFNTREAKDDDLNFILNSWLKSNRHNYSHIDNDTYYRQYKNHVVELLQNSVTLIACSEEDPDHIYGYITFEDGIMHYLYIKYTFRKMGMGTELIEISGCKQASIKTNLLPAFNNLHLLRQ